MFISFEGMNGSGKSTQAKLCAQWLVEAGHTVTLTREPGGTPGAEEIRNILLQGEADKWSRETEILLFNAARRDLVERVIRPQLAAKKIVVSDRYIDSTIVLQTLDDQSGELRRKVDMLHQEMIGLNPDITIMIDVSLPTVQKRVGERNDGDADRMEQVTGMQLHEYNTYRQLAAEFPERIVSVSGEGTPEEVALLVRHIIEPKL